MKLVYTHEVFTQQTYGGVSRYFVELIKNIRKLNVDVSIRIFGGFYINEYLREIPAVFGIKVPPIKYTGLLRRKINQLAQNFWIMQNKPSIIHQSYYSDSIFDKRIKVVLTVPDMIHELHPDSFSDNGETSVLKKRCCERADKIIAISKTTRNDLVNLFGIDPKKIEVIYLASSLEGVTPEQEGKVLFQNYILYVGDRHGYKNFDVLIRAYAKSKQVQNDFNLVCFGGGEFSSSEENKINVLDLKKNVYQISGNDRLLALYYQNAKAFIYPSLYEGFGMPPLEAMSFSCPVICSNRGSIPEIVGDAGIYFDPESPDHVQEVLEKSLFDDVLLKDLVHRGKERNRQFSWEKCARETLEVYRALCN